MADGTTVDCVWALGAKLGEGPLWVPADGMLWFVDIKSHAVHRFDPATGAHSSWQAPDQVGWVQPTADGRWLAGLKTGLHWFDPETGAFDRWFDPEPHRPDNRLNDSAVDRHGRLWFGSMDDGETEPSGQLHRLGNGGQSVPTGLVCTITNGPAISPDGGTLYHVNTLERTIVRAAIHDDGSLGAPQPFAQIEPGGGFPDGAICDAQGGIWIGLYGGWGARRYAPDGALTQAVAFPVANVTKIALGGPDLRTAYATTAGQHLSDADRAKQPLAGGLFAFPVEVPGIAATPVAV